MNSIRNVQTPNASRYGHGGGESLAACSTVGGVTFMPQHSQSHSENIPSVLTMTGANYLRYVLASLTPWSVPTIEKTDITFGSDPKSCLAHAVGVSCLNLEEAKKLEDYRFYQGAVTDIIEKFEEGRFLTMWDDDPDLRAFHRELRGSIAQLADSAKAGNTDTVLEDGTLTDDAAFTTTRLVTVRSILEFALASALVAFLQQQFELHGQKGVDYVNGSTDGERSVLADALYAETLTFDAQPAPDGDDGHILWAAVTSKEGNYRITIEGILANLADLCALPLRMWQDRERRTTDESIITQSVGVTAPSIEYKIDEGMKTYDRLIDIMEHWDALMLSTNTGTNEESQTMPNETENQGTPLQEARKGMKRNSPETPLPEATLAAFLNEIGMTNAAESLTNPDETPGIGSETEFTSGFQNTGSQIDQPTDLITFSVPLDADGNPNFENAVLQGSNMATTPGMENGPGELLLGCFVSTPENRSRLESLVSQMSEASDYEADYIQTVLEDLLLADDPRDMNDGSFAALQEMIACQIEPFDDDEDAGEEEVPGMAEIMSALVGAVHQMNRDDSDPLAH